MTRPRVAVTGSRLALLVAGLTAVAALALPAAAQTTTVTGLVGTSVSISTAPSTAVSLGTMALGANLASAGTLAVAANAAYTVTAVADQAAMTKWDGSAYQSGALTTPLALVPTLSTGAPVASPIAALGTTAQTLMTGTGITSDSVTLQLQQTLLSSDPTGTYRTVITYTAAPAL